MVMCRDLTWHPGCRAQSDILQPAIYIYIHITGNWTLKTHRELGMLRSEQISGHRGISVAPHFLGSCFFTQKALWSGPPPEGCINTFSSPTPCLSPWADVDHDAMLTYCLVLLACFLSEYYIASGIKVFGLATRWTSAVFICCHVRVIESPSVCYSRCEPLDSCVDSTVL